MNLFVRSVFLQNEQVIMVTNVFLRRESMVPHDELRSHSFISQGGVEASKHPLILRGFLSAIQTTRRQPTSILANVHGSRARPGRRRISMSTIECQSHC